MIKGEDKRNKKPDKVLIVLLILAFNSLYVIEAWHPPRANALKFSK